MEKLERTGLAPSLAVDDPLKKREEFAVSLRKQKIREIVSMKRRRIANKFQLE